MIGWIVGSSLRFRGLVVALAAGLLAYGVVQLRDAPVDVLPEFTPPTVEIQTEALGLSASEVEQLITVPIEQDLLAGVAFVDEIRSQSVPGLSSIVAIFEPGTDLLAAPPGGRGAHDAGARACLTCRGRPRCCSPCPRRAA